MGRLTPKQTVFVNEYLKDLNATQAAIRAGYSKRTADRIGSELLGKTWVLEAVQKALTERATEAQLTQAEVFAKLNQVIRKTASDAPGSDLRYSSQLRALELAAKVLGLIDRPKVDQPEEIEDDGFMEALDRSAREVWGHED